jgi:hypothetical protein
MSSADAAAFPRKDAISAPKIKGMNLDLRMLNLPVDRRLPAGEEMQG